LLAVELEGGTWSSGRHTRGVGFANDCEKMNEAVIMGWHVLRFPSEQVTDGTAVNTTMRAIGVKAGQSKEQ
jgi:very-short-patch-repair endonuclease